MCCSKHVQKCGRGHKGRQRPKLTEKEREQNRKRLWRKHQDRLRKRKKKAAQVAAQSLAA